VRYIGAGAIIAGIIIFAVIVGAVIHAPPDWTKYHINDKEDEDNEQDTDQRL
jgi:hypothetical protein